MELPEVALSAIKAVTLEAVTRQVNCKSVHAKQSASILLLTNKWLYRSASNSCLSRIPVSSYGMNYSDGGMNYSDATPGQTTP